MEKEQEDFGAADEADRLERERQRMEERSSELEDEIGSARETWESRKGADEVPGAQDELDESELEAAPDEEQSEDNSAA